MHMFSLQTSVLMRSHVGQLSHSWDTDIIVTGPWGGLCWVLCNSFLFVPVFWPTPPSSVSLASHDKLDVIYPCFPWKPENKNRPGCVHVCVHSICVCVYVSSCQMFPQWRDLTSLLASCSSPSPSRWVSCSLKEALHTHTHQWNTVIRVHLGMQTRRITFQMHAKKRCA